MAKLEQIQNEIVSKGNGEDSLLAIYIIRILEKYSSPDNKLSSQDVMEYLKKDYSICDVDESDPKRKNVFEAQRKKVRRYLDTLAESYWVGCIKKEEGKTTREGYMFLYRNRYSNTNC